jgi:hypothetical protein
MSGNFALQPDQSRVLGPDANGKEGDGNDKCYSETETNEPGRKRLPQEACDIENRVSNIKADRNEQIQRMPPNILLG